jgi:hypothetical protein
VSESYSIQLTSSPRDPGQAAGLIARTFGVDRGAVLEAITVVPATLFHGLTPSEFERLKEGLVQLSSHGLEFRRTKSSTTRMGKALMLPVTLRDGVAVDEGDLPVLKPAPPPAAPERRARADADVPTRRMPPTRKPTQRRAPAGSEKPATGRRAPASGGQPPTRRASPAQPPARKRVQKPDQATPPVLKPVQPPTEAKSPPVLKPVTTPREGAAPPVLKPVKPPPAGGAPPVLRPVQSAGGDQAPPVLSPVGKAGTPPPPQEHTIAASEMFPVRVLVGGGEASFRLRILPLSEEQRSIAREALEGLEQLRPEGLRSLERGGVADVLMGVEHAVAIDALEVLLEDEIPASVSRLS